MRKYRITENLRNEERRTCTTFNVSKKNKGYGWHFIAAFWKLVDAKEYVVFMEAQHVA